MSGPGSVIAGSLSVGANSQVGDTYCLGSGFLYLFVVMHHSARAL